jgi:hypothetical protein
MKSNASIPASFRSIPHILSWTDWEANFSLNFLTSALRDIGQCVQSPLLLRGSVDQNTSLKVLRITYFENLTPDALPRVPSVTSSRGERPSILGVAVKSSDRQFAFEQLGRHRSQLALPLLVITVDKGVASAGWWQPGVRENAQFLHFPCDFNVLKAGNYAPFEAGTNRPGTQELLNDLQSSFVEEEPVPPPPPPPVRRRRRPEPPIGPPPVTRAPLPVYEPPPAAPPAAYEPPQPRPLPAPPRPAPAYSQPAPLPIPVQEVSYPAQEPEAPPVRGTSLTTAAIVVVGFAIVFAAAFAGWQFAASWFGGPDSSIQLQIASEPPNVRLSWDPESDYVKSSRSASLYITDGAQRTVMLLTGSELARGQATHSPQSTEVTAKLVLHTGGGDVSQIARIVLPSVRPGGAGYGRP